MPKSRSNSAAPPATAGATKKNSKSSLTATAASSNSPFLCDGFNISPAPLNPALINEFSASPPLVNVSPVVRRSLFGGVLSRVPVSFSFDQKLFFLASGSIVKIHALGTGDAVGSLIGHDDAVTCIQTSISSKFLLWTGSLDGSIKCWDFYDQTCLFTLPCHGAVLHLAISGDFIYANVNSNFPHDLRACKIISIDVKKYRNFLSTGKSIEPDNGEIDAASSGVSVLYKSRHCVGIAVNPLGSHLASVSNRQLTIFDLRTGDRVKHSNISPLSCLQFHPQDDYLVTGDDQGRILLWHRYADARSPVVSKLHWHSGTVNSLQFTSDGVYLLSGGLEAVLVLWQLETGHKQFIPRFQSAIASISISPDSDVYAVSCTENVVNFVSAVSSKIIRSIYGIHYSASDSSSNSLAALHSTASDHSAPPLAVDPRTGSFVFPSHSAAFLQFFDLSSERQLMELNVTQRQITQSGVKSSSVNSNFVGGSSTTRISHFSLNATGELLVTIERRHDGQFKDKERLKVWLFNRQLQLFQLNTNVLSPHSSSVHSIYFHPSQPQFVTLAHDNSFKVWQQIHKFFIPSANKQSQSAADKLYFICKYQLQYRDFPCLAAAFSPDGTKLAASFGQVITIWNTGEEYSLNSIIAQPNPVDPVRSLLWLNDRIISLTADAIFVWDPATHAVLWNYRVNGAALAVDSNSSRFAVVLTRTRPRPDDSTLSSLFSQVDKFIAIFSPDSPVPQSVFSVSDLRLERLGDSTVHFTAEIAFRTSKKENSNERNDAIVYWNKFKQLVEIPLSDSAAASNENSQSGGTLALPESQSLFDKLYGSKALRSSVSSVSELDFSPSSISFLGDSVAEFRKIFSGPVHILPPTSVLFQVFMDSMLKKRSTAAADGNEKILLGSDENSSKDENSKENSSNSNEKNEKSDSTKVALKELEEKLFKQETSGNSLFRLDSEPFRSIIDATKGIKFSLERREFSVSKSNQTKKRAAIPREVEENESQSEMEISKSNSIADGKSKKKSKIVENKKISTSEESKKRSKREENGEVKKSKK